MKPATVRLVVICILFTIVVLMLGSSIFYSKVLEYTHAQVRPSKTFSEVAGELTGTQSTQWQGKKMTAEQQKQLEEMQRDPEKAKAFMKEQNRQFDIIRKQLNGN